MQISRDDGLLGHLYQGARDRDWALGPLIDKQIEKTLTYELDRATAILGYMDERARNLSMLERFHGHRMNKRSIQGVGQMRGTTVPHQPIRHASMHLMLKVANESRRKEEETKQKRKVKQEKRPNGKGI